MSRINVSEFFGIAPKLAATNLQPVQAQIAKDARLLSGAARPVRGLAFPTNLSKPTGEIKTIWPYKNETDWLCWSQDVNIVRTPVAGDTLEKIYFTGTDKPRVTTKDLYDDGSPGTSVPPASYILGIPAPVGPPVVLQDATTAVTNCRTFDGAGFTNEDTDINNGTANDVPLFLDINDAIYFGHSGRIFDAIKINVGTAATGGVVAWEYWNGSAWAAVPSLIDGTSSFQTSGTNTVEFTDPGNWVTTSVNGVTDYWIRARVTTALTGSPALTQAWLSDPGNINASGLVWVYTFVRKWSDGTEDEGGPSVPTNVIGVEDGKVNVTTPTGSITPGDYGITHKRLYRSQGGAYFLVSEVTVATTSVNDNVATASLGVELTTTFYLPPPDGMIGICELPNGVMAGFFGNVVYLSEPYKPWAYPTLNQYAVSWGIVAIGAIGTTLVVATNGYPYIGRGPDPAAYVFQPDKGAYYPCISKRSLAAGLNAVYWATPEGLAAGNASGVTLATRAFVTRSEWQAFHPDVMHAVVWEDRYYGWFNEPTGTDQYGNKAGGAIIFDPGERAFMSTLGTFNQAAAIKPSTGELWVSRKGTNLFNQVYAWDADPSDPLAYEWKSKKFISPGLENFAFAQVIGEYGQGLSANEIASLLAQIASIQAHNASFTSTDGDMNEHVLNYVAMNGDSQLLTAPSAAYISGAITFRYWGDGILRLTRTIESNEPFPMPSGFRAETHEFAISGELEVQQVTLATSKEELATV